MNHDLIAERLWLLLAAIAGGMAALSFSPWQRMSGPEIALSVGVSTSFGVFVAPWLIEAFFGHPGLRTTAGVTWVMASGAHVLIPMLIRRLGALVNGGDKA